MALSKTIGAQLKLALTKSMREAKRYSSWAAPNAEYEDAMQAFAASALDQAIPRFYLIFCRLWRESLGSASTTAWRKSLLSSWRREGPTFIRAAKFGI